MTHTQTPPPKRNIETVISIAALIVSLAAVAVAVLSDWSQRKHMRLSVTPIPAILYVQTATELSVILRNSGTGPMIVQSISYNRGDGTSGPTAVAADEFKPNNLGQIILYELESPTALAPGEEQRLISFEPVVSGPATDIRNQALRTKLNNTEISVKYSDIYKRDFDSFVHRLVSRNII